MELVNKEHKVSTRELAERMGTSLVTIRADINELAERGLIIKGHGGALSTHSGINLEVPYTHKSVQNLEAKNQIATIALTQIQDDDVIILDSGSTTLKIAERVDRRGLTVITNDLKVGMALADKRNITLMFSGGALIPSVYTVAGADTISFFTKIKANTLFLGCDALDFEWGISNRTMQEVAVKQAMMRAAHKVFAVCDHSKFHRQVFAHLCNLQQINGLITDKISDEDREALERLNIEVLTPHSA